MLKFIRRQGDSSNTIAGIIMLIMLAVFVGPDVLPTLLSRTFPFLDEGVPCSRLRSSEDRAMHQSLIGREAINPLTLRVIAPSFPNEADDTWIIRVIVQNDTIGTVPLVYDGNARIGIGAIPDSSGLGLVFSNNVSIQQIQRASNSGATSFANETIRILGPRQKCVLRVEIPRNIVNITPNAATTVRAYYRINTPGQIVVSNAGIPPIFSDQGLAIIEGGIEQSEEVLIPFTASAN